MGLFGELDAADVSDNPFYVPDDVYSCVLTELTLPTSKSGGRGLSFKWVITEEDSDYNEMQISEWVNVYLKDEDAKDKQALGRDRARLKSRLQAIGMTPAEMNNLTVENDEGEIVLNEEITDNYVGLTALITVVNTKDKNDESKVYTNIRSVRLDEDA